MRDWLKEHPEARPLHMAYFGSSDPGLAASSLLCRGRGPTGPKETTGAKAQELGPQPGWYAVSVVMRGGCEFGIPDGRGGHPWFSLNSFAYFSHFRPIAHAGWSIYIYHITPKAMREGSP